MKTAWRPPLPARRAIGRDELLVDIAGEKIAAGDGHDRGRHQRADGDGGKGDAREPGGEHVQEQRRNGEIVAEAGKARRHIPACAFTPAATAM